MGCDITWRSLSLPPNLKPLKSIPKTGCVTFSIGKTYMDVALCDVVVMDACHMILGRVREIDALGSLLVSP
jgi:hypothetical protein